MATQRDISLDPFHAIGKLLYNKRAEEGNEAVSALALSCSSAAVLDRQCTASMLPCLCSIECSILAWAPCVALYVWHCCWAMGKLTDSRLCVGARQHCCILVRMKSCASLGPGSQGLLRGPALRANSQCRWQSGGCPKAQQLCLSYGRGLRTLAYPSLEHPSSAQHCWQLDATLKTSCPFLHD